LSVAKIMSFFIPPTKVHYFLKKKRIQIQILFYFVDFQCYF